MSENDPNFAFMPMLMPMPMYGFLNDIAIKKGKTVQTLILEAIGEKIEKLGFDPQKEAEKWMSSRR